jgi:hypothetical protein
MTWLLLAIVGVCILVALAAFAVEVFRLLDKGRRREWWR